MNRKQQQTSLIFPVGMAQQVQATSQPSTPLWTEEEQRVLEENRIYYEQMALIAAKAESTSPKRHIFLPHQSVNSPSHSNNHV